MKLPAPNTEPFDEAARSTVLGRARGKFLHCLIGDEPIFHLLKTRTKVDVGTWFFKRRVWAGLLQGELLLFAAGKRPYAERIPFDQLGKSEYNHVTGEVMLAPVEGARVTGLKTPPLEGLRVLAHIHRGEKEHGST